MLARSLLRARPLFNSQAARSFGAMDQLNMELFEHKFTSEMEFRSSFDKMKCFRVMDQNGEIITKGYDNLIPEAELLKMFFADDADVPTGFTASSSKGSPSESSSGVGIIVEPRCN